MDASRYRRLIGKQNYLIVTRSYISHARGMVAQFMQNPKECHLEFVFRILQYIKRAPGKGLLYKNNGHIKIEAYADDDHAGDVDDRKSTSGLCIFLGVT